MRLNFAKKIILFSLTVAGLAWIIFFTDIRTSLLKTKSTDECLACHEDKDLTMDVKGKKKSLFVDKKKFENGVHAGADCKDCHAGYNAEELPHSKTVVKVDCKSCHDDVKSGGHDVHTKVDCASCHNPHYSGPAKEIKANLTDFCTKCHNEKHITVFKGSVHAKNNVQCSSCHNTAHDIKKIVKSDITKTCNQCHQKAHEKIGNILNVSMAKDGNPNAPVCTDCHGTHQVSSNKVSIQSNACLKCHLDATKFPGTEKGSANFVQQYKTSIHSLARDKNGNEAAGCIDCHGNHLLDDPKNPQSSTMKSNLMETCGKCHADEVSKFKNSAHGKAYLSGKNKDAPSCTKCHGEHNMVSIAPNEKFTKIKQTDLCLSCHKDTEINVGKIKDEKKEKISDYHNSLHYKALENGNTKSASCADCHGAHEMDKADVKTSKVYYKNIMETCGKSGCHEKQKSEYMGSIHQTAVQSDNKDAPTCNNCHGNHMILGKKDEKNLISSSKGIVQVCSDCHNSLSITGKNDMRADRVDSYNESIHGIFIELGNTKAANCSSCHSNHNIRKEDDPQSSVNPANIRITCGQKGCHPDASVNPNFVSGKIHLDISNPDSGIIHYISLMFKIFTYSTLGGLLLYMLFDLRMRIKEKRKIKTKSDE